MKTSYPSSAILASGPQFASLVALGPKITPLVVSKLTISRDFFAVELCKHEIKNIQLPLR